MHQFDTNWFSVSVFYMSKDDWNKACQPSKLILNHSVSSTFALTQTLSFLQPFSKYTGNSQGEPWDSDTSLLRHSGTTTSLSHILFPFPLSLPRPHVSTGNPESAVDHFNREHLQLNLDRLRHWQRHLPICDGGESASDDWTSVPHARLVTAKHTLFYRTFQETESTLSCDLYSAVLYELPVFFF